jgi:hypothetical protein
MTSAFFTDVYVRTNDDSTRDLDARLATASRRINLFGLTRNYYVTPSFISRLADKAVSVPVRVYAMHPYCQSREDRFRLEPAAAQWGDPDRYEQMVLDPLAAVPNLQLYTYNFPCSFAIEEFDESCRVMLYGHGKRGTDGPIFVVSEGSPLYAYFESQMRWLEMLVGGETEYWQSKDLRVEAYRPGTAHERN